MRLAGSFDHRLKDGTYPVITLVGDVALKDDTPAVHAHIVVGRWDATTRGGHFVDGVIGSSETWNSELDRVQQFHDRFGTTAEEMETASAAQIAAQYDIPFLGIRVVSNNITNEGAYDPATGAACQEYVLEVVKTYISRNPRAASR